MKRLLPISIYCLSISWISAPLLQSGIDKLSPVSSISADPHSFYDNAKDEISSLYRLLDLQTLGLSEQAFAYAMKGYKTLQKKKLIGETGYLAICDFSQSSKNKRFYLLDLVNNEVMVNTYVAHGRNSGGEYANRFSNRPKSLQSSLGFYITSNTYFGEHGLSLRVRGIEPGFNDKAMRRNIVLHGADYIQEDWLRTSKVMGRSYGCPAVPKEECNRIIDILKNGNCLFIYHPSKNYLKGSKILNG